MPDLSPSVVKTGSVQVKFADGSERALPVHGITPLEVIWLVDELGVKNLSELLGSEATVAKIRFLIRAAAHALTFEKIGEIWTPERIGKTFADADQISKVFLACLNLSSFPQPPKTETLTRKQTPYH